MSDATKFFGLTNKELGFLMARIGLGANLFLHGIVRVPKLHGFATAMEKNFAEASTILPSFLVKATAYSIPVIELLLGIAILLGIATRWALLGTTVQMLILIAGCCFLEQWDPLDSQMFLLAMSAVLMANLDLNRLAITSD